MSKRLSHTEAKARNDRFISIVLSAEVQEDLKKLHKCKHVSFLKKLCEEKYGLSLPTSAIYKCMKVCDERFASNSSSDIIDGLVKNHKVSSDSDAVEHEEDTVEP